ncbi:hypothetical protein F5051DRAFT_430995 [Lentinula edodes]|nr:hypothetical protein F5051DRAFT_430995 [Lentinula edodes]
MSYRGNMQPSGFENSQGKQVEHFGRLNLSATSGLSTVEFAVVLSLGNPNASHEQLPPLSSFTHDDQLQPPSENIDWNLLEDLQLQLEFSGSREEEGIQALNNFLLNIFEHGPDNINSDDEFDLEQPDESSDSEDGNNPSNNPSMRGEDAFNPYDGLLNKHPQTDFSHKSPEWFPRPNRMACTLDILMHLPRSVFSVRQSEPFLGLLRVNGIQDAMLVKTMKDLDVKLQGLYGIQTFGIKLAGTIIIMICIYGLGMMSRNGKVNVKAPGQYCLPSIFCDSK